MQAAELQQEPQTELLVLIMKMGAGSYSHVRELDDGTIIGIGRLIFTTAIYVDMNEWGYSSRFCFDNEAKAVEQYLRFKTGDDIPEGFIAQRPEPACDD